MAYIQDITKVDGNFCVDGYENFNLEFHDVTQPPFQMSGLYFYEKDHKFCRLPLEYVDKINDGVKMLAWHTSGVQVRFRSNANQIALSSQLRELSEMSHMPLSGNSGFDLYVGEGTRKKFIKSLRPSFHHESIEQLAISDNCCQMREWTLYFPLYNGVNSVKIGINKGATIEPPSSFTIGKPVVFYGASITQGGCVSRPGNSYTAQICRWLDADMINLGFSGSALGEEDIAKIVTSIDSSIFVFDYDANAPDIEHLKNTHKPLFNFIRQSKPNLPIIIISMASIDNNKKKFYERRDVIKQTYLNAKNNGDERVWFVDGETLFGNEDRDACTVDGCHPNDLGFYRMAKNIYPYIKKAFSGI